MRTVYEQRTGDAREIERQISTSRDKIVGRSLFGEIAPLLWKPPLKPAAEVAAIAKCSIRTAERYLAGEFEVPFEVVHVVMGKLFRRR